MFKLNTACVGESYHTLTPGIRLVEVEPVLGQSYELRVGVSIDYRTKEIYGFRYWLVPSLKYEESIKVLVTEAMFQERSLNAKANLEGMIVVDESHPAWVLAVATAQEFRRVMDLNLFELPETL